MTVAAVTLVGMAVMIGMHAYFLAPEGWSTLAPDEAQRAWHALQVTQGRLIYRDLWVQYTPISFYWHALAFRVFGPSLEAIRLALVATGTLTLALLASVAHRLAGARGAVLAGALFLTFGIPSYNSGYPAWEAMAFSVASLWVAMNARSFRSACVAGVLAGLATMAKINVGCLTLLALLTVLSLHCRRVVRTVVAPPVFLTAVWLVREMPAPEAVAQFLLPLGLVLAAVIGLEGKEGRAVVLGASLLGWSAACAVILMPFAVRMGCAPLLEAVVAEPLRFSRLIRYESPILRLGPAVYAEAACLAAAVVLPFTRLRPAASAAAALGAAAGLTLSCVGALPALLTGLRFILIPAMVTVFVLTQRHDRDLLKVAVWAAMLHLQVYPSQSGMHLAWALVIGWPLLVGISRATAARGGRMIWCVTAVLGLAQLCQGATVMIHTRWARVDLPRGGIAIPMHDEEELVSLLREVRRDGPSSLLDLTSGCLVAFLAELDCPLRHVYFWKGFLTPSDQEAEVARLSRDPPPVAVRRHAGRAQFRWDVIAESAPILARWVAERYRVLAVVGRYEVLARVTTPAGEASPP